MNTPISLLPPGRTFVRSLILRSLGGFDTENMYAFARNRWGEHQAGEVTKAAVAALSTSDFGDAARVFFGLAREQSIIGRLVALRRVPFNVRMVAVQSGATGYWVSQAKNKPLSRVALNGSQLDTLKVAAILVVTKEMLQANDPAAEDTLQGDLERAVTGVLDEAFLDPSNSGIANEMPASISSGATVLAATNDFGADLRAMIQDFQGNLAYATFVTDPATATRIATMTAAGGRYLFPNIGPRGGELLGIPVLTTRSSGQDSSGGRLTLLDPTGIAAALGRIEMSTGDHATLQMSDDPNDDTVPIENVSMWQTNSVAFKAEIFANWNRQRPGSVIVLEGL